MGVERISASVRNVISMLAKPGYVNYAIIFTSTFAAGGIMLGITPFFIPMMEELKVSALMMGSLVVAFILGYVFFGGFLLFRTTKFIGADPRKVVAMSTGVIGISGFLMGFTPNYWSMWIFRFAVGLACIVLSVSVTPISLNWFPDKLNLINTLGNVSLIVGCIIICFFGPLISGLVGGWGRVHSVFGAVGLLAFILWLKLGKSMPSATATDGGGNPSARGPVAQVLMNRYVWCSAGILYFLLSFAGIFSFIFVALAGRFDLAVMSKSVAFPPSLLASVLLNGVFLISASLIGLWLVTKTGRRKPFTVIPGFLTPILSLALFSLPFSGVWIAVILELIVLILFMLLIVLPTWLTQLQELPGVGFDMVFNALGAILLIGGTAATILPIALGWALDQGWATFKCVLYLAVLSWSACGLGGLLIPEPGK